MRVGDVAGGAASSPRPLDGVRVLAVEQMQALPFATQLLARLGADVVKIEPVGTGDIARGSQPAMADPAGRAVGATFLRTNLNKRSVCIDLKQEAGRDLVLRLAPRFDVFAENLRAGAADRLGLGSRAVAAVHPGCIYVSVSGFGSTDATPYAGWPAFAPIADAMCGIYERNRRDGEPPDVAPFGALADIGASLFASVGILAALRQRDRTGLGQHVDVAMLDSMLAITDIVTNLWSMGLRGRDGGPIVMHGFRATDGWFIVFAGREPQFATLMDVIGRPDLVDDPRLATRQGWVDHMDDMIRPAVEGWAAERTKVEACAALAAAGIAAGPCYDAEEVVHDAHTAARNMLVELPRTDGVEQPVLIPGNPIKMSGVPDGDRTGVPWLGEHTDEVLAAELDLSANELADLRAGGVIA